MKITHFLLSARNMVSFHIFFSMWKVGAQTRMGKMEERGT